MIRAERKHRGREWQIEVRVFSVHDAVVIRFDSILLETRVGIELRLQFADGSRALRDLLTQRWLLTERTYEQGNSKQVYYLSMEFLPGRTLIHNIINLGVEQFVRNDLAAVMARVDLIASGDSGPLHLGVALRRQLLAVYGPTDPAVYGPYRPQAPVRLHRTDAALVRIVVPVERSAAAAEEQAVSFARALLPPLNRLWQF